MKLKQMPVSLARSLRLKFIPIKRLGKNAQVQTPVIGSLTTIASRLPTLHLVIRSLMEQTYALDRLILWVNDGLKNQIPTSLRKLEGPFFEIRYSTLDCPHLKLLETKRLFPDRYIATFDDDEMYDRQTVELLYKEHLDFPECVIGSRCRTLTYDEGEVNNYKKWPFAHAIASVSPALLVPLGAFGVLYPPNCFHQDVHNASLYLSLAPRQDDLWFKAMAVLNGTGTRQNRNVPELPTPIFGTQVVALKNTNKGKIDRNKLQWQAIERHYKLDKDRLLELV